MNAPQPIPYTPEGPQPLVRETAAGAAYPVEALGPLRDAVEAVQGMTQAPVAIPAASALTVRRNAKLDKCACALEGRTRPHLNGSQKGQR